MIVANGITPDCLRILRRKGASGFHAFRHTDCNVVDERTARLKLAHKLLRHNNVSATATADTHTSKQSEHEAAISFDGGYSGDLFPVVPSLWNRNKNDAVN